MSHDDTSHSLELRGRLERHFDIAGPGSRFCALCIDGAILLAGLLGVALAASMLGILVFPPLKDLTPTLKEITAHLREQKGFGQPLSGLRTVMGVLTFAAINFGYYVFFELLSSGQTPGKRLMNLRAIANDGSGMTAQQVLIRNALRLVDVLPMGYALGGAVALYSASGQRLGDLAAGTLVVKVAGADSLEYAGPVNVPVRKSPDAPTGPSTPSLDELGLVRSFLSRRTKIEPLARAELADKLASRLYRRYGGNWPGAEPYLERLLDGRHRDT
jgi:uncharacterized RDD family membrane protein YckC